VLDGPERDALAHNIIRHAGSDVTDEVQRRVVAYVASVDTELGDKVATGLGVDTTTASYKEAVLTVETRANRA